MIQWAQMATPVKQKEKKIPASVEAHILENSQGKLPFLASDRVWQLF